MHTNIKQFFEQLDQDRSTDINVAKARVLQVNTGQPLSHAWRAGLPIHDNASKAKFLDDLAKVGKPPKSRRQNCEHIFVYTLHSLLPQPSNYQDWSAGELMGHADSRAV